MEFMRCARTPCALCSDFSSSVSSFGGSPGTAVFTSRCPQDLGHFLAGMLDEALIVVVIAEDDMRNRQAIPISLGLMELDLVVDSRHDGANHAEP